MNQSFTTHLANRLSTIFVIVYFFTEKFALPIIHVLHYPLVLCLATVEVVATVAARFIVSHPQCNLPQPERRVKPRTRFRE
jgi:hypothetical protein